MWAIGLESRHTSTVPSPVPVARVVTERRDSKDKLPFNYNYYVIGQTPDGSFYQSGPRNDVDFGHHGSDMVSDASLGIKRSE
jgi:hypothetical protein